MVRQMRLAVSAAVDAPSVEVDVVRETHSETADSAGKRKNAVKIAIKQGGVQSLARSAADPVNE